MAPARDVAGSAVMRASMCMLVSHRSCPSLALGTTVTGLLPAAPPLQVRRRAAGKQLLASRARSAGCLTANGSETAKTTNGVESG